MRVIKFINKVIIPFKFYLIVSVLTMIFFSFDFSLKPYLLKLLVNAVVLEADKEIQNLWLIALYFILIQFLSTIFGRIYDWCSLKYEPSLKNHITTVCFEHILKHDYYFFQYNLAGNLSTKINNLVIFIPSIISIVINNYFVNILSILISITILWNISAWFTLAMFIWVVFVISISLITIYKLSFLTNSTAEAASKISGNIVDSLINILSIYLFSRQKHELKQLNIMQKEYLTLSMKRRWFILKFYSIQSFSFVIYQSVCLIMLINLYTQSKVTPGDFILILLLNFKIIDNLCQMSDQMRSFSENWGTVDQALKVLYTPQKIQDNVNARPLIVQKGEIIFDKVDFCYENNVLLFKQKSIIINPNQKIGLVGYSGSGKSTFVNLILRLYDVIEGRILIDGQDIQDVTRCSLYSKISVIPQNPVLFHRSLMENIRYGRIDATDEEVIEAAKKATAHEFISKLPEGYNFIVGERGENLSGGQRQRIAIARAILKNAPILILDEATSQLDYITEKKIQESLWNLMQGKTSIIIAHRLLTLQHMDRILVFEKGKIIANGTHQELLVKEGLYKTLWDASNLEI